MGQRQKDLDRVLDAAAQVAADLSAIQTALEGLVSDLPARRRQERGRLIDVIRRVEGCQQLLSAELDRSEPEAGFLRRAIAASVIAAEIASAVLVGFVGSEISQDVDLRSPVEIVHSASGDAAEAESRLDDADGRYEIQWSVSHGDPEAWGRLLLDGAPYDSEVSSHGGVTTVRLQQSKSRQAFPLLVLRASYLGGLSKDEVLEDVVRSLKDFRIEGPAANGTSGTPREAVTGS